MCFAHAVWQVGVTEGVCDGVLSLQRRRSQSTCYFLSCEGRSLDVSSLHTHQLSDLSPGFLFRLPIIRFGSHACELFLLPSHPATGCMMMVAISRVIPLCGVSAEHPRPPCRLGIPVPEAVNSFFVSPILFLVGRVRSEQVPLLRYSEIITSALLALPACVFLSY